MIGHLHRAIKWSGNLPFRGCVRPRHCNPQAHDGVYFRRLCACGHVQDVNRNGFYLEKTYWFPNPGDITDWRSY